MFKFNATLGKYVKVVPGTPVNVKSNARIGSHWPRNHGVRYMSK
jgi:hypothetical protein